MKNLNSKKARQRIATLYNIITVSDREMREFLNEDWSTRGFDTLYTEALSEYQEAIIELVEVYEIPHIIYELVIKERAEEQAA